MKGRGKYLLNNFKRRWQLLRYAEVFLYSLGIFALVALLFSNIVPALLGFLITAAIFSMILSPWKINIGDVSSYLDKRLGSLENSTGLLLQSPDELGGLAQLQQRKIGTRLEAEIGKISPETNILKALIISGVFVFTGVIAFYSGVSDYFRTSSPGIKKEEIIVFTPVDSAAVKIKPPVLTSQKVIITYPSYTGIPPRSFTNMNIEAVEGSIATWHIGFDMPVDNVQLETKANRYQLGRQDDQYSGSSTLNHSGFYNFRFKDSLGAAYVSDLYSIKVERDRSPEIEISNLDQFTSFNYDEQKQISFDVVVKDDFGIAAAYIIATVSKGTGEAVKFREEKLSFETQVKRGTREQRFTKKINLDEFKMGPGDELYFYVEALDLKQPAANRARSETYFAVIKDTASYGYQMENALGVDLMPDYFRSQRQLIIDTEKLIGNRNRIPQQDFNSTSNNLGFDQKALRLRYGQFMGDESEGIATPGGINADEENHDHEDEDPLAAFTHDHDGNNDHNLVAHDHEDEEENKNPDPLKEFLHDHGDPEAATLFTDSLKSKLRQALDIMWDAELHLRLNEPEKSLPFQYRALQLIQDIKNSARIYVHRIGYDPPPIKEEVRLTGKIDGVSGFQKQKDFEEEDEFSSMRSAVNIVEEIISNQRSITPEEQIIAGKAGEELAFLAINEPGKHLETLQQLKWLAEGRQISLKDLQTVQRGLMKALPGASIKPARGNDFNDRLNNLLIKELENNDR
ncbi:hypothetical protein BH23BAC2_BH23BAC2_17890 [soil metagenome]